MNQFVFYSPTKVVFGKDAQLQTAALVKEFGGSRVFIAYGGGSVVKSGLLSQVEQVLEQAGIAVMTMGGIRPNPRLSMAYQMIEAAVSFGADFILGVGGGSVIDTAKGVALGVANPELDIWDIWNGRVTAGRSLPVGAVLTLSATGTEMSDSAVLTDEAGHLKKGLSTDLNRPKFAVMNPELTFSLPDYQVRCGIVDIMMHTLDRYFTCYRGNELTDAVAEALLRTTINNGRIAAKDKTDYDAMSELMWCGSLSHNGLTGLGAVKDFSTHALGHPLSAWFDLAHGASLSVMWGAWAEYVYRADVERFVRYARQVWGIAEEGEAAARAGISATVTYFRELEMPVCFSEAGIPVQTEEMLERMADQPTAGGTKTVGNFRPLDKTDIMAIYRMVNH